MAVDVEENEQLISAASGGETEVLQRLLIAKCDPDYISKSDFGRTPLLMAIKNKHLAAVKLLIEHGAKVKGAAGASFIPLISACGGDSGDGDVEIAKYLLDHGASLDNFATDSALNYAAMYGLFDIVKLLVSKGADINQKGSYGRNPLLYAASSSENPELVRYLIDHGADIDSVTDGGENALLDMITRYDNPEIARILIEKGIDFRNANNQDITALQWAAYCGRYETAKVILGSGADPNQVDNNGEAAIHRAINKDHKNIVELLLEFGASADAVGEYTISVLEYAEKNGYQDLLEKPGEKDTNESKDDSDSLIKTPEKYKQLVELINIAIKELRGKNDMISVYSPYNSYEEFAEHLKDQIDLLERDSQKALHELTMIFYPTSDWDDSGGSQAVANETLKVLNKL